MPYWNSFQFIIYHSSPHNGSNIKETKHRHTILSHRQIYVWNLRALVSWKCAILVVLWEKQNDQNLHVWYIIHHCQPLHLTILNVLLGNWNKFINHSKWCPDYEDNYQRTIKLSKWKISIIVFQQVSHWLPTSLIGWNKETWFNKLDATCT